MKSYATIFSSRALFIAGAGASRLVLELILLAFKGDTLNLHPVSINYGILTGLLLFISNIVLLESLTKLDVNLGYTIYRLNTLVVVILSYLFLGEGFGIFKIIGILLGVFSINLLYRPTTLRSSELIFFIFGIFPSPVRAIYGAVSKATIDGGADIKIMTVLTTVFWVTGGLVYTLICE